MKKSDRRIGRAAILLVIVLLLVYVLLTFNNKYSLSSEHEVHITSGRNIFQTRYLPDGSEYTLPTAPEMEGCEFRYWIVNGEKMYPGEKVTVDRDLVISPLWAKTSDNASASASGTHSEITENESIPAETETAVDSTEITAPAEISASDTEAVTTSSGESSEKEEVSRNAEYSASVSSGTDSGSGESAVEVTEYAGDGREIQTDAENRKDSSLIGETETHEVSSAEGTPAAEKPDVSKIDSEAAGAAEEESADTFEEGLSEEASSEEKIPDEVTIYRTESRISEGGETAEESSYEDEVSYPAFHSVVSSEEITSETVEDERYSAPLRENPDSEASKMVVDTFTLSCTPHSLSYDADDSSSVIVNGRIAYIEGDEGMTGCVCIWIKSGRKLLVGFRFRDGEAPIIASCYVEDFE